MRIRIFTLLALFILELGTSNMMAHDIVVSLKSSEQKVFNLFNVRKITFSMSSITVQRTDNSNSEYQLSELRNLNFLDGLTNLTPKSTYLHGSILTYPNPIIDMLNIKLSNEEVDEANVRVVSLDGITLLNQEVRNTNNICLNLSHLSSGVYFLILSNNSTSKVIKVIKK